MFRDIDKNISADTSALMLACCYSPSVLFLRGELNYFFLTSLLSLCTCQLTLFSLFSNEKCRGGKTNRIEFIFYEDKMVSKSQLPSFKHGSTLDCIVEPWFRVNKWYRATIVHFNYQIFRGLIQTFTLRFSF